MFGELFNIACIKCELYPPPIWTAYQLLNHLTTVFSFNFIHMHCRFVLIDMFYADCDRLFLTLIDMEYRWEFIIGIWFSDVSRSYTERRRHCKSGMIKSSDRFDFYIYTSFGNHHALFGDPCMNVWVTSTSDIAGSCTYLVRCSKPLWTVRTAHTASPVVVVGSCVNQKG